MAEAGDPETLKSPSNVFAEIFLCLFEGEKQLNLLLSETQTTLDETLTENKIKADCETLWVDLKAAVSNLSKNCTAFAMSYDSEPFPEGPAAKSICAKVRDSVLVLITTASRKSSTEVYTVHLLGRLCYVKVSKVFLLSISVNRSCFLAGFHH